MSFYGLLEDDPQPTAEAIEGQLDGNLCRCVSLCPLKNVSLQLGHLE